MIIQKEKINFEELGLEILSLCPNNKDDSFQDGYLAFTYEFYNNIESFWKRAMGFPDRTFEFNSELNSAWIIEHLEAQIGSYTEEEKNSYWQGALLAEALTLNKLIYYLRPDNLIAA